MLIGLAGMAYIVSRGFNPIKSLSSRWKMFGEILDNLRAIFLDKGIKILEKMLRKAKIYSMRLEQYFSLKLQKIADHKNGNAERDISFWRQLREKTVFLNKAKNISKDLPPNYLKNEDSDKEEVI
jgi:hypothetical protein